MNTTTIITKEIDGYEIIIGFGKLAVDPEGTKKVVAPLLAGTKEFDDVRKKAAETAGVYSQFMESRRAAKEAYKVGDASNHQKHTFEAGQRKEQINQLQKEGIELAKKLEAKNQEITAANKIYFEPKKGEILLEDVEISNSFTNLKDNELLTVDGTVVPNNRGVRFVKDGKVITIERLGEVPDGPLMSEITPEEFESMRMASLTSAEKDAEKAVMIDGLASQAANMRAKLEIQADPDALTKAQDWYNAEVVKVEAKYG